MSPVVCDTSVLAGQEIMLLAYDYTLCRFVFITVTEMYNGRDKDNLWGTTVGLSRYLVKLMFVFPVGTTYRSFGPNKFEKAKQWAIKHSIEERVVSNWWYGQTYDWHNKAKKKQEDWSYQSYLDVMTNGIRKFRNSKEFEYYI